MDQPYILAMSSHRGGTGRTTSTLALAWALGQLDIPTAIYDADPVQAAFALACEQPGRCSWKNVRALADWEPEDSQIVVVDGPVLTHEVGQQILGSAHGILLHSPPDPLSFRTIPTATQALHEAQSNNPNIDMFGILLTMIQEEDEVQTELVSALRKQHGDLIVDPGIPYQSEYAQWPLEPGTPPPEGPARAAYLELAQRLAAGILAPTH